MTGVVGLNEDFNKFNTCVSTGIQNAGLSKELLSLFTLKINDNIDPKSTCASILDGALVSECDNSNFCTVSGIGSVAGMFPGGNGAGVSAGQPSATGQTYQTSSASTTQKATPPTATASSSSGTTTQETTSPTASASSSSGNSLYTPTLLLMSLFAISRLVL